jgi:uncharacterized protein YjbI with pentapeptide repeats
MPRKRSAVNQHIEPPQLPKHLLPAEPPPDQLVDQASYRQCSLHECDFSSQIAADIVLDQVVCKRLRLHLAELPLAQVLDVRFDTCDLAGSAWEKAHMRRVEFLGCRLLGIKVSNSSFEDMLVHNCNAEFARFWSATFKATQFEHCSLREASFQDTDLEGVVFRDCDLTKADLRGAKLAGTDFRGSIIDGVQVGLKELHGAIIDPSQVMHIAALVGVVVKGIE